MSRALNQGPEDPSLHHEPWRALTLEREANSALAEHQWSRFRQGLKRLEHRYSKRVPEGPLRRALAEDAFHCAAQWRKSPRVVRSALQELLSHQLGPERFTFAMAEYWRWAVHVSPPDLPAVEQLLEQARQAMQTLSPTSRENLEQMLRAYRVGERAPTLKAEPPPEPRAARSPRAPKARRR